MYIGIDIGGTNIRLASANNLDNPTLENKKHFPNSHSFETNLQNIQNHIDKLDDQVEGIGIGIAGTVNKDKSMLIEGDNIPEFENQPIKELLASRYKCKVVMDNDGVIMACGEAMYGENKNIGFTYLIWGTGIGGATVKYENAKPVITKIERQRNTNLAAWESVCGGKSIEKIYKKRAGKLDENQWREVMQHFLRNLSDFITIVKPQMIIFGGGIAVSQFPRIQKISDLIPSTTIKLTTFVNDPGLFGALATLKESQS